MKTNDIVINKINNWLEAEDKSYEWLAEKLGVSKALVGFMLKGDCTLKLESIEQVARVNENNDKRIGSYRCNNRRPIDC